MNVSEFLRRWIVIKIRRFTRNEDEQGLVIGNLPDPTVDTFCDTLMLYYKAKVLPVERELNLDLVYPVSMNDCEFKAPPSMLFLGPPSVGKTTMIEFLMGCPYPNINCSSQTPSDRFVILSYGNHSYTVPSSALLNDQNFPYPGLNRFGNSFIRKCYASYCPSPLLKQATIVDTPGVISAEKCRNYRAYDYDTVVTFFADRADKIFLVFDVYKMDFSENIRNLLQNIQQYEDKIMIVLNKIDSIEWQDLDRINECLMWYLSRTFRRAEMTPVFLGSFWEKPLKRPEMLDIVNRYQDQLLLEIRQLPFTVNIRRLNDVIRRAKLARTHALISRHMPKRIPVSQGKLGKYLIDKTVAKLTKTIYPSMIVNSKIYFFDLPHPMLIKKLLLGNYPVKPQFVSNTLLKNIEQFIFSDVSKFVRVLPQDSTGRMIKTGRLDNPVIGTDVLTMDWCAVNMEAAKYHWREAFTKLGPKQDNLHASHVKDYMQYAGLPMTILNDIWRLVDSDNDELINEDQFCLLNWLVMYCKRGYPLPAILPRELKPPEAHKNPCDQVAIRRTEDIPQVTFWPRWE